MNACTTSWLRFAAGLAISTSAWAQASDPATPTPLIARDAAVRLSEHAYAIPDNDVGFVPNVGIVVGERATLVIDTGVGARNGEIIWGEVQKLTANTDLYIATTHYHSEHETGAAGLPDSATMIRSRAQQEDLDESGQAHFDRFSSMSANMAMLLEGVNFRGADVLFDETYALDLGGVSVQMLHVGPAHTAGDTIFFVEGEGVLYAGDVAMDRYPGIRRGPYDMANWRAALAIARALAPTHVVPSHGPFGSGALVEEYDTLFATLQERAAALKAQGRTADEVAALLTRELGPRYVDRWGEEDLDFARQRRPPRLQRGALARSGARTRRNSRIRPCHTLLHERPESRSRRSRP